MSFRQRVRNLIGNQVQVITTARVFRGRISSVGTDNLVLALGAGKTNRRVLIIRFDQIVAVKPSLLL